MRAARIGGSEVVHALAFHRLGPRYPPTPVDKRVWPAAARGTGAAMRSTGRTIPPNDIPT